MLKSIIASGVCLIACSLPIRVLAASFSDIFVFGDSLVDDGNFFEVSKTETPDPLPPFPGPPYPNEPYFEGRFSNGYVWPELLGEKIGVEYKSDNNYAFGGAGTGRTHQAGPAFSGLLTQVDDFTNTVDSNADPNALYIISAGPNDQLNTPEEIETSIGNISEAITTLSEVGATNFFVTDLPDFGLLPGSFGLPESEKESLSLLSDEYNQALALSFQDIEQNSGVNIISFDINTLVREVVAAPEEYGFSVVSEAGCLDLVTLDVCENPDEYFFWDFEHPSAASHRLLADFAATKLKAEHVPENSYPLGISTFIGFIYFLKKRYKEKPKNITK